jgi:hypothetical protein
MASRQPAHNIVILSTWQLPTRQDNAAHPGNLKASHARSTRLSPACAVLCDSTGCLTANRPEGCGLRLRVALEKAWEAGNQHTTLSSCLPGIR